MSVTGVDGSGKSARAVAAYGVGRAGPGTIGKTAWRCSKRLMQAGRFAIVDRSPFWLNRTIGPGVKYLDMLLFDHGVFRMLYLNKHRVGERVWRSAQPAPHHIRALARQGIRTIVNLRGERLCGSYWLERDVCARYGISLVNFKVHSRMPPSREQVEEARALFARVEYPMLMHCKSGADRVGLMSVLYRHLHEGVPIDAARDQLSLRYGHFRQADTGVLDRFFEQYLEDDRRRPTPFLDWVHHMYDPTELKRSFRAAGWARRLVDGVLRRE
jgi:protein tyrosine/serine phosphatase